MSYQVPDVEGIHAIEVYAVNYDVDGPMEQETSYLISLRDIAPWIDPGDPPVIIIG